MKTFADRFIDKFKVGTSETVGASTSMLEEVNVRPDRSAPDRLLITAVATTSGVDLDDEVVMARGLNPAPLLKLGAVYYNHDYSNLPVATVQNVKMLKDGSGWVITAYTARNEFARDVAVTVQDGAIRAGSIGFVRNEYGSPTPAEVDEYGPHSVITRSADWFEWSITPMPANQEALIQSIETRSVPLDDRAIVKIESLASSGRISRKSARAMGVPERKFHPVRTVVVPRLIPWATP